MPDPATTGINEKKNIVLTKFEFNFSIPIKKKLSDNLNSVFIKNETNKKKNEKKIKFLFLINNLKNIF